MYTNLPRPRKENKIVWKIKNKSPFCKHASKSVQEPHSQWLRRSSNKTQEEMAQTDAAPKTEADRSDEDPMAFIEIKMGNDVRKLTDKQCFDLR